MNSKTLVPSFFLFAGLLLASAGLVAADGSQGSGYQLVSVKGELEFTQVLPGYTYSKQLTVEWAAPPEVLKGLNADKVVVLVTVFSNDGLVDFEYSGADGGKVNGKKISFELSCVPKSGSCDASKSVLTKAIGAVLVVPSGAKSDFSEPIIVQSELKGVNSISTSSPSPASPSNPSVNPTAGPSTDFSTAVAGDSPNPSGQSNGLNPTGYATSDAVDYRLGILAVVLLAVGIALDKLFK